MVELIQSQAGRPLDHENVWLNDAQVLARKLFEHLTSMQTLTNIQRYQLAQDWYFDFIDHSSVKVVTRAAFETYLVFFFIYSGSDRSLSEFRHKIWRYAGLVDRQRLCPTTAEKREVQAAEKTEVDRLKSEIEASSYLATYNDTAAKKVLKGEWRGGEPWAALSTYAGFHETYFRNVYGYLCGYSHASYASALQVREAQLLEDQQSLTSMCIGIGLVLMAHFACAYVELFDGAKPILDNDPKVKALVNRWNFSAADWAEVISKQLSA